MPLLIFKLAFAAIALGLLAVIVLIVRELWQKRRSGTPTAAVEPGLKGGVLRMPGRAKQETEPELPPPPRKRQLRSLTEVEQSEATAGADEQAAEQAIVEAPPAEDQLPDGDFSKAVLARLEAGFAQFEAGEIALDTYIAQLMAERSGVDLRIATLRPGGASEELEQALAAAESVRWCLDWASGMMENHT